MLKKVGYLGPAGTFSEEAVLRYLEREEGIAVPCRSLLEIFAAVSAGELDEGVVPLENSYEGAVNLTLDLLADYFKVKIRGEMILPVCHNLLVRPGTAGGELAGIISHPQALAQCRDFIRKRFPAVPLAESSSTAEAARKVAETAEPWGAIGSERAAAAYGLVVREHNINDQAGNTTRFVVLGREESPPAGPAKTSIIVAVTDRPGALYHILKEFALRNINLTRIESRPAKKRLGDYVFFIDFLGHSGEAAVSGALEAVARQAADFKNLGSYPADPAFRAEGAQGRELPLTIEEARADIDIVDFQIVELLAKRAGLVTILADLKKGGQVRDPAREREVLDRVREIAIQKGFDPDVVEQVYGILFSHFTGLQAARRGAAGGNDFVP
ncbi:MAG: prephenate dehydratase [Peptococcaceae bacterium]|nr:prephenate dehydratase [Peptococcaceae bacterium]